MLNLFHKMVKIVIYGVLFGAWVVLLSLTTLYGMLAGVVWLSRRSFIGDIL